MFAINLNRLTLISVSFTLFTYLFIGVHVFVPCGSRKAEDLNENIVQARTPQTWDFIVFSQQWPITVCTAWKNQSPKNKCNLTDTLNHWTIHGIWPSNSSGKDPQFCDNAWKFNINDIQPLIGALDNYWPNVYLGTSQDEFWEHEWSKHGTCAASNLIIDDEYGYFARGIQLLTKYDMNLALATTGIVPNEANPYKLNDIHAAILNYVGVNSTITCFHDKHSNRSLIKEIRYCLDGNLGTIDCPNHMLHNLENDQGCPKDDMVFYLPIQSNVYNSFSFQHGNMEL